MTAFLCSSSASLPVPFSNGCSSSCDDENDDDDHATDGDKINEVCSLHLPSFAGMHQHFVDRGGERDREREGDGEIDVGAELRI